MQTNFKQTSDSFLCCAEEWSAATEGGNTTVGPGKVTKGNEKESHWETITSAYWQYSQISQSNPFRFVQLCSVSKGTPCFLLQTLMWNKEPIKYDKLSASHLFLHCVQQSWVNFYHKDKVRGPPGVHRRYNVALPTPPKYCALLIIELVAGISFCALEILTALRLRGHDFKAIHIISRFWNSKFLQEWR